MNPWDSQSERLFLIFDAHGNGNGDISPTLMGDHQNHITDYTALIVDGGGPLTDEKNKDATNEKCRLPATLKIRCGKPGGGKGPLVQIDKSATLATGNEQILFCYSTAFWESRHAEWKDAEGKASIRSSGGSCGGGSEVLVVSCKKVTGPIMANSHPGSYTGQDAWNDMLVTATAQECQRLSKHHTGKAQAQETGGSGSSSHSAPETDKPTKSVAGGAETH